MATAAEEIRGASAESAESAEPGRIPYGFARRHGVLVRALTPECATIAHRENADALAFLELRRLLARPLKLQPVPREEFDRLLQASYEEHQTIEGFDTLEVRTDLSSVADQLPEPEDLLEADDDAPIIRSSMHCSARRCAKTPPTSTSNPSRIFWSCACAWTACCARY